jgi:di/tricarboxylate transporter
MALSGPEYYVLFVMGAALVLIVSNRLAPDLVALLVLLALGLSGVLTPEQALAGFSSPAVITIIGLFVITGALERTGVIQWLSERLAALSGHTETRLILVLMGAGALLSLVVNNIAAGAVLLPAALRIARSAGVRPSKVLLPLAFGTLVGGMATLFTTANILLSSFLQEQGLRPLTMLDFLLSGGLVMLAGLAYMVLVGRRLLPGRESPMHAAQWQEREPDLSATYQLGERLWEVLVLPGAPLVGQSLSESNLGANLGITVLAVLRDEEDREVLPPRPDRQIAAHDVLLVLGREGRVRQLEAPTIQVIPSQRDMHTVPIPSWNTAEVIVAPRSPAIGRTLADLQFRSTSGLTALALWRGQRSYRTDVGTIPLQAGDALLMIGPEQKINALANESGYIVPRIIKAGPPDPRQGQRAALIAALAIGASIVGVVPTPEAMLAGAAALVLARCIRMDELYGLVEWRIVFLIAGMAPFSVALKETGLDEKINALVIGTFAPFGALGLVAGFAVLTFAVVQVLGGQVTALVVGPLAVAAALQAGVNPHAMGVAVSIACSASFLTPVAHPVNLLMMNPGSYTPADFLRVGSGMSVVCFLALLLSMLLFWQL